jgi:glucuronoarabinoxylan endo-1,4-beta-xylanase
VHKYVGAALADAVEDRSPIPASYLLAQNYPNPFNPSTTIKYELLRSSEVRLSVFDMRGREVSVVVNERRAAGVYEVKFDASKLASGVHLYRLQAGGLVQSRKLLVLR